MYYKCHNRLINVHSWVVAQSTRKLVCAAPSAAPLHSVIVLHSTYSSNYNCIIVHCKTQRDILPCSIHSLHTHHTFIIIRNIHVLVHIMYIYNYIYTCTCTPMYMHIYIPTGITHVMYAGPVFAARSPVCSRWSGVVRLRGTQSQWEVPPCMHDLSLIKYS